MVQTWSRRAAGLRASAAVVIAVVVLSVVAGCGRETGSTVPPRLTSGDAVAERTLLWWAGADLHVGDRVVAAPRTISQAVGTEGGVYVLVGSRLLVLRGTTLRDTQQRVTGPLVVSPSGRHLAYLDPSAGPRDEHGTRRLTVVLWDTRSGRRVAASHDGMGDAGRDDLADLYEDGEPGVRGFDGGGLVVAAATGGYRRVSLETGRSRGADDPTGFGPRAATQDGYDVAAVRRGGRWVVSATGGNIAVLSPDRSHLLVSDDDGRWSAVGGDGRVLDVPGLPGQVQPGPWTDGHTVALLAYDDDLRTTSLRRCDLAARRCSTVAEGRELGTHAQVAAEAPGSF